MTKMVTADLFSALRFIKAANLREEIKPVFVKMQTKKLSVSDIGIETILTVLEAVSNANAEDAFYAFLSHPFEMSPEEIKNMELLDLVDNIKEMAMTNDLKSFFESLSGLITSN